MSADEQGHAICKVLLPEQNLSHGDYKTVIKLW